MNRHFRDARLLPALVLLILALSACNSDTGGGSPAPTATPRSGTAQATTAAAGIQLGVQPCPETVKDPAHWMAIVPLTAAQQVEEVMCGYLMGVPTLQAVVKIGHKDTHFVLDIEVYTAITSPKPARLFALIGLLQGEVSISNYNTLLTAQVDPPSSQNKGRSSAEQQELNTGQGFQQWRLSAVTTAQNFAQFVLGWDPAAPITVFDHDRTAIGQTQLSQASGVGTTPFAIRVPYAASFPGGTQEGIIVLSRYSGNHVIAGAVMVKVLLSPS